MFIETINYVD
jgi:hypothetical protein